MTNSATQPQNDLNQSTQLVKDGDLEVLPLPTSYAVPKATYTINTPPTAENWDDGEDHRSDEEIISANIFHQMTPGGEHG